VILAYVSLAVWLLKGGQAKKELLPLIFFLALTSLQKLCLCRICPPPPQPHAATIVPHWNQLPPATFAIAIITVITPPSPVRGEKLTMV
jgi:hypothetical protein